MNRIFNRVTASVLAVLMLVLLASCTSSENTEEKSLLWYQDGLKGVRCILETNMGEYDSFTVKAVYGEESDTVFIESPEELSGLIFERKGNQSKAILGSSMVDMSESGLGTLQLLLDAFRIKEDSVNSVVTDENGDTVIGALGTGGVYSVTLGDDGTPKNIRFDGLYNIRISGIVLLDDVGDADVPEWSELIPYESESDTGE